MADLAQRCQAATGPDRELDAEIALALGIVRERDGDCFYGHKDYSMMVMERGYYDHEGNAPELPHYTASIDAAMMLLPPDAEWSLDSTGVYAVVNDKTGAAATPALALAAACLRAGGE